MKFSVPSKQFHSVLAAVGKVINSKNALQILDNFLVRLCADGSLTVTGMDVENLLTATLQVNDHEGEGAFCINASRMIELFKEIPDQGVTVEVDERLNVHISYASGESDFVAQSAIEYPEYDRSADGNEGEAVEFTALASQFIQGMENTLFAVSTDDYKVTMTGVLADVKPDGITFVATDSRVLVRYCDSRRRPGVTASGILPVKPANILKSIFDADDEIRVVMTSRSAEFRNERFVFNCRFILGNFPDYARVIGVSRNSNFVLTADRALLANTVRRVGLFCDKGYDLIKYRILPDHMIVKAEDTNLMTRSREQIPCSYTGDELTIGFKGTQIVGILNVLKGQDITVKLADASKPGIFEPTENDPDTSLLILLMPMTVGEF